MQKQSLILFRRNTESESRALKFQRDFERFSGYSLEPVDVDTRDGAELAHLYDIVRYPAIVVVASDGRLQQSWQADNLPTIDNVAGYMHS